MKIVFFGTSNFALPILEELLAMHDVVAVVTMPDALVGRKQELTESPVSLLAKDLKLNTLKPDEWKNNEAIRVELKNLQADIFVVASYGSILPDDIINMPRLKTLNAHPSLLPRYRGPTPIQTALLNGDAETGTSIILLDSQMDHGPILAAHSSPIDPDDNYITLTDKLARLSAKLLGSVIFDYAQGKAKPLVQDDSQATFTKIITKQDGKIDWQKSASQIYNQFQAFYPWPGIWTIWNGQIIKITECVSSETVGTASPSTVVEGGVVVCGNQTTLKINRLQLAGKNEVSISEFLNGYQDFIGSRLE